MDYQLPDSMFERSVIFEGDAVPAPEYGWPYETGDNVKPKFDTVAAAVLHNWSMTSDQNDDCGDAQLGNGWHARFDSERAILREDSARFVSAWRIPDTADMDDMWAKIEAGARYMDDPTWGDPGDCDDA